MDWATIQDFRSRCKAALDAILSDWGVILVIFLAAFSSFEIGRLSAAEEARPAVQVRQAPAAEPRGMAIGGYVVASKNGSVYHLPWCASAGQIKPENQVWFASEEDARAAGLAPAKGCKGLTNSEP